MKKNTKKPITVTTGLMWRITALALGLWLLAMGTITLLSACNARTQFRIKVAQAAFYVGAIGDYRGEPNYRILSLYESMYWDAEKLPLGFDRFLGIYTPSKTDYYDICLTLRKVCEPNSEPLNPQPVVQGDGNYLFFQIRREEGRDPKEFPGYCYIDLEESDWGRQMISQTNDRGIDRVNDRYRKEIDYFTGYFEGGQFHLVEVVDVSDSGKHKVTTIATPNPDRELVTLWPGELRIHLASREQVTVDGTTFDNMGQLLRDVGTVPSEEGLVHAFYCSDIDLTGTDGTIYDLDIAVYCHPLAFAMSQIWPIYILTIIPLVVVVLLIRRRIRRELVAPMTEVIEQSQRNIVPLFEPAPTHWKECVQLQESYTRVQEQVQKLKLENNQLHTALEYAKNAESSRKKMISSISHELKTPLAIIHSYAEGLEEGIAREKQSEYLDVILEETENMDALVLEMLDHSRLEAGRVKLQTDQFSLAQLVQHTINILAPLAEDRGLILEPQIMEDYQITADEARMGQAVRNLISNAIKYTRPEGKIWINVYRYRNQTHLTVENQCNPLPQEALDHIWDSFYRSDASQKAKGSGLGLPIVKEIIQLHGGTCQVCNTSEGVKFLCSLP